MQYLELLFQYLFLTTYLCTLQCYLLVIVHAKSFRVQVSQACLETVHQDSASGRCCWCYAHTAKHIHDISSIGGQHGLLGLHIN